MTSLERKHSLLFYPFLRCFGGLLFGYTLVHWYCLKSYDMLTVNEMVMIFLWPAVLAMVLLGVVLRPGISLLLFSRRNTAACYYMVTFFCLVIPILLVQQYLETATGKLTVLETINQYERLPKTKYYQVKHYHLAPSLAEEITRQYSSGRSGSQLNFEAYFTQPIFPNVKDTLSNSAHFWLCSYYEQHISANITQEQRLKYLAKFNRYVATDYPTTPFHTATYWERIGITSRTGYYENAVAKSPRYREGACILFKPHYDDFSNRNGNKLIWCFVAIVIALALYYTAVRTNRFKIEEPIRKKNKRKG